MANRGKTAEVKKPTRKVSRFSTPVEEEELEFIQAIEEFKQREQQPFPSWTQVLGVLKGLGYRKA